MKPNDFSEGINFSSGRIESPFFNFSNAVSTGHQLIPLGKAKQSSLILLFLLILNQLFLE